MVVIYDCSYVTFKFSIFVNEIPLEMVLPNGNTCIKCPVNEIERLIRTYYNVEDLPKPKTTESQKTKKKKISEWSLKKLLKKETDIAQKLVERLNEVYDDEVDFREHELSETDYGYILVQ